MSNNKGKNKTGDSKFNKIEKLESELEDTSFSEKSTNKITNVNDAITVTKQTFIVVLVIVLIAVVGGLWSVYYYTNKNDSSMNDDQSSSNSSVSVEQVEKSISGKSAEEDKKNALASAQNILNESLKDPKDLTIDKRVAALEDGDVSVVTDELKSQVRFTDKFESDKEYQATTYQALVVLAVFLSEDNTEFNPVSDSLWKEVYLDQESGIAYVPLSVFYEKGTAFSFEMVYVDGEWKLAPYSLLNAINLSAKIQENSANNESSVVPSVPTE